MSLSPKEHQQKRRWDGESADHMNEFLAVNFNTKGKKISNNPSSALENEETQVQKKVLCKGHRAEV